MTEHKDVYDVGAVAPEWSPVRVRLSDLAHWADNPKLLTKAEAVKLQKSSRVLGRAGALLVGPAQPDGKRPLYDGHQRADIWAALYGVDTEIWALESNRPLADDERRAVSVMTVTATGSFDWDILSSWDFPALAEWGMDADLLKGWDNDANNLKEMLRAGAPESVDAEPQIDRADELQVKWQTALAQLWRLGEHRLLIGDCTVRENVDRLFGNKRARLGITSPPYAVGKEYETETPFSEHIKLLEGVADRALDIIEAGGFFFVNFGEIAALSHAGPLTGSARQCIYPISKDYWRIFHEERKMDLYAQRIWYKPFNRLQQPFWSYHTSIPHHQEWEHIWTWRLPGGEGDKAHDWDTSVYAVWDTRNESTDDKPLTRHVAAFPVGIPERAIKAHTDKGDLIWEPFCGSGTTIIAAHNLNRRCFAMEISPAYCAVILQRFLDATGIQPELAMTSPAEGP